MSSQGYGFFLWSCMDVRVGLWKRLSTEELMLSNCGVGEDPWLNLLLGLSTFWRHPTPVLLPGKPHGCRSLIGCSLWSHEESDMTEQLHFSLSCIGEGNGNPLQCSCLENPSDGGAWWAAIYGVAQSRTQLKRLSSSSSRVISSILIIVLSSRIFSWK